jgi:hypothetical protein
VVRGFKDNNIYNKTETHAPVPCICDVRFMLVVANKIGSKLRQYDVKNSIS